MTEIQIKNLIKEYEKEYIEFMEIEKLPQYKIDFFEINVEESDAAGFASAAQAYYNTKTDEHILRICKSSEIPRYIVFHEFTHILDTEMYAKQDSWKVSAKYCYAAHESRLHQNDRCKRFTLCLVLTVRFRSLAPWGKLFQLFI